MTLDQEILMRDAVPHFGDQRRPTDNDIGMITDHTAVDLNDTYNNTVLRDVIASSQRRNSCFSAS